MGLGGGEKEALALLHQVHEGAFVIAERGPFSHAGSWVWFFSKGGESLQLLLSVLVEGRRGGGRSHRCLSDGSNLSRGHLWESPNAGRIKFVNSGVGGGRVHVQVRAWGRLEGGLRMPPCAWRPGEEASSQVRRRGLVSEGPGRESDTWGGVGVKHQRMGRRGQTFPPPRGGQEGDTAE